MPDMTRLLILFVSAVCCSALETPIFSMDLGSTWTISSRDNASIIPFETDQKYIHSALFKKGLIQDPLWRFGDTDQRWIAKSSWEMTTSVDIRHLRDKAHVELFVDGADTFTTIFLGGIAVGKTKNQHLKYFFDVTSIVQKFQNEDFLPLVFQFESAINVADAEAAAYPYAVPPPANFTTKEVHGEGARQFARKAQCDFGWDWGPCFAPIGILRGVQIRAYSTAIIRDVTWECVRENEWEPEKENDNRGERRDTSSWIGSVRVFLNAIDDNVRGKIHYRLVPTCDADAQECKEIVIIQDDVTLRQGENVFSMDIPVDQPYLWWVREMGKQNLNDLTVTWYGREDVNSSDANAATYYEVSTRQVQVGFREVKMIEDEIPNSGLSFYFRVNNRRIFAKGVNLVPLHPFHDRVTPEYMEAMIKNTLYANNNIVRVWGGGIYQDDLLYDLADKYGIMIWQEFMFACAMYPTSTSFLKDIEQEVKTQMRRLKFHSSVVLWGGNNENEQALVQNWYGTSKNFDLYREDYLKLYVQLMKKVVEEEGPYEIFLVSSPSNGKAEEKEHYVSKNPQSEYFGDIHYYNYESDCWNATQLMVPRMASEFGLQSLPSLITLAASAEKSDLSLFSDLMVHRQHHPLGNGQILKQISRHFPTSENFDHTIYLSQLAQAMCVRFETEHYRRFLDHLDEKMRGHTSGALYWQLNDVWAAPSWSSVELNNRWKILHHYISHIFSPLLVSPVEKDGDLQVFAVYDLQWQKTQDLTLEIQIWTWSEGLIGTKEFDIGALRPSSSSLVQKVPMAELLQNTTREESVFILRLLDQQSKQELCRNTHFTTPLKNAVGLKNPELTAVVLPTLSKNGNVQVQLSARHIPAAFVWIETEASGHFSENALLLTELQKTIEFIPHERNQTADSVQKTLRVRSLFDVTQK